MRRLRIADELAERIDAVRGDVPRDRWVARALEQALGSSAHDGRPAGQREVGSRAASAPARALGKGPMAPRPKR